MPIDCRKSVRGVPEIALLSDVRVLGSPRLSARKTLWPIQVRPGLGRHHGHTRPLNQPPNDGRFRANVPNLVIELRLSYRFSGLPNDDPLHRNRMGHPLGHPCRQFCGVRGGGTNVLPAIIFDPFCCWSCWRCSSCCLDIAAFQSSLFDSLAIQSLDGA